MEKEKQGKHSGIKIATTILALVVVVAVAVGVWYFQVKKPHDLAVESFNAAVQAVASQNDALETSVEPLQALINSQEPPFEEAALTNAQTTISVAEEAKREIPQLPEKTEEINAATQKLEEPLDYSQVVEQLQEAQKALEDSIQQMRQITNPPEAFVIQRLKGISDISEIQAVTEDNDPNGNLNKAGGYTAAVYFASPLIDQSEVYGSDLVDKGTDSGGCVEVYKTAEDAEARNTYLSAFDGPGLLNPGSHHVIGTVVVRTSSELTATQQQSLEKQICDALIAL